MLAMLPDRLYEEDPPPLKGPSPRQRRYLGAVGGLAALGLAAPHIGKAVGKARIKDNDPIYSTNRRSGEAEFRKKEFRNRPMREAIADARRGSLALGPGQRRSHDGDFRFGTRSLGPIVGPSAGTLKKAAIPAAVGTAAGGIILKRAMSGYKHGQEEKRQSGVRKGFEGAYRAKYGESLQERSIADGIETGRKAVQWVSRGTAGIDSALIGGGIATGGYAAAKKKFGKKDKNGIKESAIGAVKAMAAKKGFKKAVQHYDTATLTGLTAYTAHRKIKDLRDDGKINRSVARKELTKNKGYDPTVKDISLESAPVLEAAILGLRRARIKGTKRGLRSNLSKDNERIANEAFSIFRNNPKMLGGSQSRTQIGNSPRTGQPVYQNQKPKPRSGIRRVPGSPDLHLIKKNTGPYTKVTGALPSRHSAISHENVLLSQDAFRQLGMAKSASGRQSRPEELKRLQTFNRRTGANMLRPDEESQQQLPRRLAPIFQGDPSRYQAYLNTKRNISMGNPPTDMNLLNRFVQVDSAVTGRPVSEIMNWLAGKQRGKL